MLRNCKIEGTKNMRTLPYAIVMALGLVISLTATARAAEEYTLTLKDHKFTPEELTVPADKKVTLIVKNEDKNAAEFESHDLKREKVIAPGTTAKINVGPLKAGSYKFFDEFHEDSAKGTLIVK